MREVDTIRSLDTVKPIIVSNPYSLAREDPEIYAIFLDQKLSPACREALANAGGWKALVDQIYPGVKSPGDVFGD